MGVLKRNMLGETGIAARGGAAGVRLPDLVERTREAHEASEAELERARERAGSERARIVAGAEEAGFAAGKEAGFAEGRAEGIEAGRAEGEREHAERLEKVAGGWEAALASFEAHRGAMVSSAREDVLRLALAVAERVVRRAIDADASAAASLLDAAIAEVRDASRLTVRASERDAPAIGRRLNELAERLDAGEHTRLVIDATLQPGDVVVETDAGGMVDARLATQLDRIAEALLPGRGASAVTHAPRLAAEGDGSGSGSAPHAPSEAA